jgi:hypothetical protein
MIFSQFIFAQRPATVVHYHSGLFPGGSKDGKYTGADSASALIKAGENKLYKNNGSF